MDEREELVTWNEIANYLQVEIRTAKRWETEYGMPVHRLPSGRLTANRHELDAWKSVRTRPPSPPHRPKRSALFLLLLALITTLAGLAWILSPEPRPHPSPVGPPPRLFWRTGPHTPSPRIRLPITPYSLLLSQSEKTLFVLSFDSPLLTIVDTQTFTTRTITLPIQVQIARRGPNARTMLIGSSTDGFLCFDMELLLPIGNPVPTGGMVSDLAMTADGSKVFLAMRGHGLKRWSASSGRIDTISVHPSPSYLGLDEAGQRLFVSYQGGGPKGRPGHDSVEIFDLNSERSIGFLPDLPLVGGEVFFSPDTRWMIVDGWDACRNTVYDGQGCPARPANLMHLFRMPEVSLLKSIALPIDAGGVGPFLGNSNAVLLRGPAQTAPAAHPKGLSVFDLASYSFRETLPLQEDVNALAVAPITRRAFAGTTERGLFSFDFESPHCGYSSSQMVIFLSADGVSNSQIGSGYLHRTGWTFDSGILGQSFRFQGQSTASFSSHGRSFGPAGSSLAFYVRPAQNSTPQVFLHSGNSTNPGEFWTFSTTSDSRVQLQLGTKDHPPVTIRGSSAFRKETWAFVAASRDNSGLTLFVDGKVEGSVPADALGEYRTSGPFVLGGTPGNYFNGAIDEVAFFSGPLPLKDVERIHKSRLAGHCKP